MKTIVEASKQVPLLCETDVIVVGGGPAGIGAALSAARNGVKTVLIENYGFLGGNQTLTFNNIYSFVDDRIQGGVMQEIINRLDKAGKIFESNAGLLRDHWGRRDAGCTYFDGEYYKYMLDTMMAESGVKVLFHAFAVDTIRQDNLIKGIIVETHEGRRAVLGKTIIDCTGVGHIAWKSGARTIGEEGYPDNRYGPFQGQHMGLGYGFWLRGLDYAKFRAFAEENEEEWDYWVRGRKLFMRYKEEGKLKAVRSSCLMIEYSNGRVWVLHPYFPLQKGEHPWQVEKMTEGEIDMRRQCWEVYEMLRDNVPGFEETKIEQTPTRLLMRDAHRLDAEYTFVEDDMYKRKVFDDSIACCNMQADVFFPNGSHRFCYEVTPYDIPYRCMISKDIDNLMAAGGTVACDIVSWSALRYCTPSVCTGQAAGTAAALAVKGGITPKQMDVPHLQRVLQNQGMVTSCTQLSPEAATEYKLRTKIWNSGLKL